MRVKPAPPGPRRSLHIRAAILCAFAALGIGSAQAQVSMYTAVDLALSHSPRVSLAEADVRKAQGVLGQARGVYIPSLGFGSSLGYSYGFPIGQPSIYNFTSQSLIMNFSQRDYIRSARAAVQASLLYLKQTRQDVAEDTALAYVDLDRALKEVDALDQQYAYANRLMTIVQQRLDAGLENKTALTQARLTLAQIHLKQLHAKDSVDMLRDHLARLTGLPTASLTTESASVPPPPEFHQQSGQVVFLTPGVQAAYSDARARRQTAFGDAKQLYRPEIDFVAQYSRYSQINNYQNYYLNFQQNNFGVGIQITLPLFDANRRAHAIESRADADHAQHQADILRDQAAEAALKLQHGMEELAAQQDVANLQRQLAQDQLDAVLLQLKNGSGVPDTPALSPKDEQSARIDERQKYLDLLNVEFSLFRARLDLLKATGGLEDWVKTAANQSKP